jgi:hypothetical protein
MLNCGGERALLLFNDALEARECKKTRFFFLHRYGGKIHLRNFSESFQFLKKSGEGKWGKGMKSNSILPLSHLMALPPPPHVDLLLNI